MVFVLKNESPAVTGLSACTVISLQTFLLLPQLPIHLFYIALQLIDALALALLHKATDKEKQEENYKSHDHRAYSFLSDERI